MKLHPPKDDMGDPLPRPSMIVVCPKCDRLTRQVEELRKTLIASFGETVSEEFGRLRERALKETKQ